jgi:parallel beta-helix repeat protein
MRYGQIGCSTALVLAWILGAVGPVLKADALCGATIVADTRLDADLNCPGNGLEVGADHLGIDLNGHTITGAGTGIGILVIGHTDVTLVGGTITNFGVGFRINTSTDVVIKQMQVVQNPEGIDLQTGSLGNTIKNTYFAGSAIRAIMLRGNVTGNDIKDNTFEDNRIGVLIFGGVDNTLKNNLFTGSTVAGIRLNVLATANVLKDNTIRSNNAGVEFVVTPTGSATGNELKGNTIGLNSCGIKGPTEGNTLIDNVFEQEHRRLLLVASKSRSSLRDELAWKSDVELHSRGFQRKQSSPGAERRCPRTWPRHWRSRQADSACAPWREGRRAGEPRQGLISLSKRKHFFRRIRASLTCGQGRTSDAQHANAWKMTTQLFEITNIARVHNVAARGRRRHDDGVNQCRVRNGCQRFARHLGQIGRQRLDLDRCENRLAHICPTAPPLSNDASGNGDGLVRC